MQNSISYWQHYLLEDIEEVSYKKSGLKNPDKADRDKDQDISSWEKKVGSAIEKNMREGDDHIKTRVGGIVFKKTGNTNGSKVEYQPYSLIDKKNVDKAFYYYPEDIQQRADDYTAPKGGTQSTQFESQDHEVSMANNSLDTIIKHAMELKTKLGEDEKDIPAWIQDHITNAANFISQAAENYHEYSPEDGAEEKTDDEIDADSLSGLMEKMLGLDKDGYTQNAQAVGPFRGASREMQMSGNLESKKLNHGHK